ncbi:MAG: metallophosphoesterase [Phycisphaerales bacterium]
MVSVRTSTLAIGDVHGCGAELRELLARCDRWYPGARLVFVGDLFTKGPRPDEVAREIRERRSRGQRIDLVCGNHDLRLRDSLRRLRDGARMDSLPPTEAATIRLLERSGALPLAEDLTFEACGRVQVRHPQGRWTVLHGGIDPALGLNGTPDHVKIHQKAAEGQPHWWERYDGRDGLLVVGHKPLPEPLIVRDPEGRPLVANVDTGCAYGGALSGYCMEEDHLVQVPSQQPASNGFSAGPRATGATRSAWSDLVRTLSG